MRAVEPFELGDAGVGDGGAAKIQPCKAGKFGEVLEGLVRDFGVAEIEFGNVPGERGEGADFLVRDHAGSGYPLHTEQGTAGGERGDEGSELPDGFLGGGRGGTGSGSQGVGRFAWFFDGGSGGGVNRGTHPTTKVSAFDDPLFDEFAIVKTQGFAFAFGRHYVFVVRREQDAGIDGTFVRIPRGDGFSVCAAFHDKGGSVEAETAFGFDQFPRRIFVGGTMAIDAGFGEERPDLGAKIDTGADRRGADGGNGEEQEEGGLHEGGMRMEE